MKIKSRLLLFIGIPLVCMLVLSFSLLILSTSKTMEVKLENQISNQSEMLTKQISDLVTTSARSYLMSIGSESELIIKQFYKLYESELIDFETSKTLVLKTLSETNFLKSGYIFITDEKGVLIYHPDEGKIGAETTIAEWLNKQSKRSKVFYSYNKYEPKLLYRVYDETYGINICTVANISDFISVIDTNELYARLNSTKVGEKGYPFLLTKSGIMLSHPDMILVNKNVLNMRSYDGIELFKKVIDEGSGSFKYKWKDIDGSVEDKFLYFNTEPNTGMVLCVTGYPEDFYDTVYNMRNFSAIFGLIVISVVGLIIFFVAVSVSKPIYSFTRELKEVSGGDGDLSRRIELSDKSEIGTMVSLFNNFILTLKNIITKIKNAAMDTIEIKDVISYGITETSSALTEISANISGMKHQTDNLNSYVNRTTESIYKIDGSIDMLNNSIKEQSLMLESSTAAITEMISSIDNVSRITSVKQHSAKDLMDRAVIGSNIIDNTQNAVQNVNNQLGDIKEMAQVISNIASQTNLLAMNAAIEAAHAGDAGKGFAVVADEIRKLAEDSSDNSTRITDTLNHIESSIIQADSLSRETQESFAKIHSEIREIVGALEEIDNSTNELELGGKDILNSIIQLERISTYVEERSILIKDESIEVKDAMNSTRGVTIEVVTAIEEIGHGTEGISLSMEQLSLTSERLQDTGENLKISVDQFKTE